MKYLASGIYFSTEYIATSSGRNKISQRTGTLTPIVKFPKACKHRIPDTKSQISILGLPKVGRAL